MSLQSLPSVLEDLILEYSSFDTTQFAKVLQQINRLPRVGEIYEATTPRADGTFVHIQIINVCVLRVDIVCGIENRVYMGSRTHLQLEKYYRRIV